MESDRHKQIDEIYEFCAPRFFDLTMEETEDQITEAERWFEISDSCDRSFMPQIREGRSVQTTSLCDFEHMGKIQKVNFTLAMESDQQNQINEIYEFCAPRFFDLTMEETEDQIKEAERWFEISDRYDTSPFMPQIREGRSVQTTGLCEFENMDKIQKESLQVDPIRIDHSTITEEKRRSIEDLTSDYEVKLDQEKETKENKKSFEFAPKTKSSSDKNLVQEENSPSVDIDASSKKSFIIAAEKAEEVPVKVDAVHNRSRKRTAKKIASIFTKISSGKAESKPPLRTKPKSVIKCPLSTNITQENQANKRQKLDRGKSRKICDVKKQNLPHKSEPEPYVSNAETVKKFESNIRNIVLSLNNSASHKSVASQRIKVTKGKGPIFATSQRTRAVKVKSSAELEIEMMATMPKFKARALNKKVFVRLLDLRMSEIQLFILQP